ncbi:hypothetical protein ACGFZB_28645 [Streptomyces cinerochromogenes]|uniref:Uncharacterized protein n=1 Tax=Streptomyces cinerochromogenes TaxID=66422 RepID=A0ABW7BE60_9ACTN
MRAYSRVGGKIRITLPDEFETEHQNDPLRWSVIVERGEYNELREQILEGDPVRAELERERDELKARAEQAAEERDRMIAQRDAAVARLAAVEAARPIRMSVPADLFVKPSDDVDELKAVIVSQAREIARLKGESE